MPVPRAKVSAGVIVGSGCRNTPIRRAVLLGQFAGELQDASRLGMPIDEDDDFSERSLALVWAQGRSLRRRRRH
jgi:hypothetical protein